MQHGLGNCDNERRTNRRSRAAKHPVTGGGHFGDATPPVGRHSGHSFRSDQPRVAEPNTAEPHRLRASVLEATTPLRSAAIFSGNPPLSGGPLPPDTRPGPRYPPGATIAVSEKASRFSACVTSTQRSGEAPRLIISSSAVTGTAVVRWRGAGAAGRLLLADWSRARVGRCRPGGDGAVRARCTTMARKGRRARSARGREGGADS